MELIVYQTSSLNKTLIDDSRRPVPLNNLSCLKGEEISWQIICKLTGTGTNARFCQEFDCEINSDLSDTVTVREIVNIPSEVPAHIGVSWGSDEDFITTKPGLFPDLLQELHDGKLELPFNYYRGFWVSVKVSKDTKAGIYPVTFRLKNEELGLSAEKTMKLEIIDAVLPEQRLMHAEWFHSDCLMSYYRVDALSEEHWKQCEAFIKCAVDNGINTILTPIFSLTMDRREGVCRPVLQLVKVKKEGDRYHFDFADLKRWIKMCLDLGVKNIELSHLFTQWGAKYAPVIMVEEDGKLNQKFGWHTPGMCEEYQDFLRQFLPQITEFLRAEGIAERTLFHVSDEPCIQDRDAYKAALELVAPYLEGFRIIDAVFDVDMYAENIVKDPVALTARYHLCVEKGRKPDYVYYLFGQTVHWSNRLFAMESRRNRVLALQLYENDLKGFLHWGFNFWYNYDSRYILDPFMTTDGRNTYVSGCPYLVYPGRDGKPVESIRLKVLHEAMQDLRALQLLEQWMSKGEVLQMLHELTGEPVAFDWRAPDDKTLLSIREKINQLIKSKVCAVQ